MDDDCLHFAGKSEKGIGWMGGNSSRRTSGHERRRSEPLLSEMQEVVDEHRELLPPISLLYSSMSNNRICNMEHYGKGATSYVWDTSASINGCLQTQGKGRSLQNTQYF